MSIPFSRSTRSLQADSYRPTIIGLFISITLLVLWTAWFLFAKVPVTETSQAIVNVDQNVVTAVYPLAVGEMIQPGQNATLLVRQNDSAEEQLVPAEVINVDFRGGNGQVQIEFYALQPLPTNASSQPIVSGAEIAVSFVSPALLVIDAAQQLSP